ncbi:MAG: hypothetical protein ACK5UB_02890 [Pseudanabaena sp.]|jgi:hypothetical protein
MVFGIMHNLFKIIFLFLFSFFLIKETYGSDDNKEKSLPRPHSISPAGPNSPSLKRKEPKSSQQDVQKKSLKITNYSTPNSPVPKRKIQNSSRCGFCEEFQTLDITKTSPNSLYFNSAETLPIVQYDSPLKRKEIESVFKLPPAKIVNLRKAKMSHENIMIACCLNQTAKRKDVYLISPEKQKSLQKFGVNPDRVASQCLEFKGVRPL